MNNQFTNLSKSDKCIIVIRHSNQFISEDVQHAIIHWISIVLIIAIVFGCLFNGCEQYRLIKEARIKAFIECVRLAQTAKDCGAAIEP